MKHLIVSALGVACSGIAYALGGWDTSVITLLIFMGIDFITGLIVGGVFHKSNKTNSGALQSRAGWKGLCKKCVTILLVVVASMLDVLLGSNYVRDAVCIAFILNETLSIIENAGLMGVPIPKVIKKAIDVLEAKENEIEK